GIRGSVTYSVDESRHILGDSLMVVRPDFWVGTANKQLNFVQHVCALLKPGGRAAMVVPDNVLYEVGSASAVRRQLLERFELHTILRLPPGLFYAAGVKANVIFFDRPVALRSRNMKLWVYDLRTDNRYSLKTRPLTRGDLREFVDVF